MEQIFFDVQNYETDTIVKNKARKIAFDLLKKFYEEELGEENVTIVGSNELSICVGERNGNEVCVNIKATAKDCGYRSTATKRIEPYDRQAAGEEYSGKETEKAEKKANSKKSLADTKKAEKKAKEAELDKVAERVKERQKEEMAKERYVVKIDGEEAIEPTTLSEAKAAWTKIKEENPDKEVKIYKVLK